MGRRSDQAAEVLGGETQASPASPGKEGAGNTRPSSLASALQHPAGASHRLKARKPGGWQSAEIRDLSPERRAWRQSWKCSDLDIEEGGGAIHKKQMFLQQQTAPNPGGFQERPSVRAGMNWLQPCSTPSCPRTEASGAHHPKHVQLRGKE